MTIKAIGVRTMTALALGLALAACSSSTGEGGNGSGNGNNSGMTSNAPVPGSEADLVATAGDRVYFALNQNTLSPEARETLDKQAAWMKRYPQVNVLVAGNCDDRGTQEYNIALGQRRANAVRNYLQAQGIAPSRISTISYGKDRPTVDGDSQDAWAQNRNAITSVQ
ncbi:peptidoglycan-associated lipoprotein Pal [Oecophyllibacter saccharovorans]|uniref:Peptidoglycan-associated lipoprotein n=1 Tax=Oecophyllibacter saccharovorans TaxID=2558360 RepID=A0A506UM29_9PROT|nr:peptidoglycan-associated lipoprotein Pal [Oecophyllibacter saccharovorans]QDH15531.1 peptidoglycan-associated lipoprotein Pal [Oecophyllibacter saccharovorans]TPW34365.1 peptidoglycan-associated lipoprotein Pal [Oecophyllibacter saccharovorans]TPW36550.1 peptidoglycan-associated lipoprotein Pal [Oecophyllibacter saccharovorans]